MSTLTVYAEINNLPEHLTEDGGYLVVRRDAFGKLWYYETYENRDRAEIVAQEIENGLVLKLRKEVVHE